MLATNQQGQTYLVAQQQPPPVNQILLTQTSQQQGGAPTKTIIILQQQTPSAVNTGIIECFCFLFSSLIRTKCNRKFVKSKCPFCSTNTAKSDYDNATRAANDCDASTSPTSRYYESTHWKW